MDKKSRVFLRRPVYLMTVEMEDGSEVSDNDYELIKANVDYNNPEREMMVMKTILRGVIVKSQRIE
jgi:hypothetical protein